MYNPTAVGYLEGGAAFEFSRGALDMSLSEGDRAVKQHFEISGFY